MSSTAPSHESITQLLNAWAQGRKEALERLLPQVYADLRRIAQRQMRGECSGHVLQSTALVHEAFLRLGEQQGMHWSSRKQFFGWMSMLMRRILVDHARSLGAAKRGGRVAPLSLDALADLDEGPACLPADQWLSLLQLHQALTRLEAVDPQQGRVVELRFFGGLSVEQTAEVLDVSVSTVKREWSTARAWLLRELIA